MKNILLLLSVLIGSQSAMAALASGTIWDVRSGATAADVNGGGFNPANANVGTDWSQATGSHANGTDLATTNGTTTPCSVTASSHTFDSTDPGNLLHINSGGTFTAGWYEVVSVSAGAATLDRACASGASTSGGTYHLGGAISLQNALDSTWSSILVAGNQVWILAGTYTLTGGFSVTDCTNALPCLWQGYTTSHSSSDNPSGSGRPLINAVGGQLDLGAFNVIKNIIFTGTNAAVISSDGSNVFFNDKVMNTSTTTGRIALNPGAADAVINCEAVSQGGFGISTGGNSLMFGNYVHDSATCIRESSNGTTSITGNILAGCMTAGLQYSATDANPNLVEGNTFYGGGTAIGSSTGLLLAASVSTLRAVNNIFYGWVTGISAAASTNNWGANNDFFANTTARTNWAVALNDLAVDPGFKNVGWVTGTAGSVSTATLTDNAADFSNVTDNQDYLDIISGTGVTTAPGSLLITSHTTHTVTVAATIGGSGSNILYGVRTGHNFAVGLAVRNKAVPGLMPGGLTTTYPSIGAVQQMPGSPSRVW